MPFGEFTVNTKTFQPREPGTYSNSTVAFGQPEDELRTRGAVSSKDGILRASVTRLLEKDVVVGGDSVRKQLVVSTSISVPNSGFTAAEVDDLLSDISEFATGSTVTRLLQGES
jgi:hypothetical protein